MNLLPGTGPAPIMDAQPAQESPPRILDAEPALEALPAPPLPTRAALEALPADRMGRDAPPAPKSGDAFLAFVLAVLGWSWRLAACTFLMMSYVGAVLVVGWMNRWLQGRILRSWWRQSKLRDTTSFEEFLAGLGPDAPVLRPRLFLRDRFDSTELRAEVERHTADGEPPGLVRVVFRAVFAPLRSLWLNLKLGGLAVLATFLLVGWGCALMTFSWEFGWNNSFQKGYEQYHVGPATGVTGLLLFIAATCYVPMAQAHLAVTGDFKAFFEFRFVWRLIRARLTAYVAFAGVFVNVAVFFEILKVAPAFFDGYGPYAPLSDGEFLWRMRLYYFVCSFFLLMALLLARFVMAHVYRSAVLKVLRRGRVTREELHPRLRDWFDRLGLVPAVQPVPAWAKRSARAFVRWGYRRALFVVLFLAWFGFIAKVYVGEFLHYHPYVAFLNHPLIQVPCVNYVPPELEQAPNK